MIIACSNCGQNMEGSADMLNMEVRCPACMEWTYPQLPQADSAIRPELMGQARLDELVNANDEVDEWHNNRRKRRQPQRPARPAAPTQPAAAPKPAQNQWYILTTDGPRGPFGDDKIIQFARAGKINASNRLTNTRTGIEVRAGDIPNLFKAPHKPKSAQATTPSSDDQWFVQTSKGDAGPFTNKQVVAFANAGKIKPKTMLRYGHTGQFIPASTVNGLIPAST